MKISVIMPVYNGGKWLRPMLESCLKQMDDVEFICVDDGSTDGSKDVLAEYAKRDKRIRAIFNEHHGVGYTVQTGKDAATGDYLLICDDDDEFVPGALEKLWKATDGKADAAKGVALIDDGLMVRRGQSYGKSGRVNWREMPLQEQARHFVQTPEIWTFLVRRELEPLIGGGDYMFGDTDRAFKIRVLADDFRYVDEPVYIWKVHESVSHSDAYPLDIVAVFDNLERWLKERKENIWPIFAAARVKAYAWNLYRLHGRNREEFLQYMIRDFRRDYVDRILLSAFETQTFDMVLA